MILLQGDIWDFYRKGEWIAVTTNGFVKSNGECVMGRGTALQAARKFPNLPYALGQDLKREGNRPFIYPKLRIVTFPVKHNWFDANADLTLIEKSAKALVKMLRYHNAGHTDNQVKHLYLPMPGCGCGGLKWADVWPVLSPILGDMYTVLNYQPRTFGV